MHIEELHILWKKIFTPLSKQSKSQWLITQGGLLMANGELYPRNSQEYLILIGQSLHSVAMIDQKYSKIF